MADKFRTIIGVNLASRIYRAVKDNGGLMPSLYKMWRTNSLRPGTYVGTDRFGNKYYENNYYFVGRNRWVDYSHTVGLDYDPSMIDADWHGWLHNRTDKTPLTKPVEQQSFKMQHSDNKSGTDRAYMPYTTVRPKIQHWVPPTNTTKHH